MVTWRYWEEKRCRKCEGEQEMEQWEKLRTGTIAENQWREWRRAEIYRRSPRGTLLWNVPGILPLWPQETCDGDLPCRGCPLNELAIKRESTDQAPTVGIMPWPLWLACQEDIRRWLAGTLLGRLCDLRKC